MILRTTRIAAAVGGFHLDVDKIWCSEMLLWIKANVHLVLSPEQREKQTNIN